MLRDRRAAAVAGPYHAVRAHPGAADLAELRRLARRRRAADHAGRRQRLERSRRRRHRPLCRRQRSAGVLLVPPPGHRRQPALLVCRRSRHRGRPGAGGALQGGRSGARGRRAHRRDHLAILHALGHPRPRQDPHSCPRRRRGIGPRLSPDPRDPVRHARICRRGRGLGADRGAALGGVARGGAARNTRRGSRRARLLRRRRSISAR